MKDDDAKEIRIKSNDPRDEPGRVGFAKRISETHYQVVWNTTGRTTRVRADRVGTTKKSGYTVL